MKSQQEGEPRISRTRRIINWAERHPYKAMFLATSAIMFPIGLGISIYGGILTGIGVTAGVIIRGLAAGGIFEGITVGVAKVLQYDVEGFSSRRNRNNNSSA